MTLPSKELKQLRRLFTKGTPLRTLAERFNIPVGSVRWYTRDIPAKFSPKTDPDFYKKIGREGGLAKVPKGFAVNPGLASRAGKIGGKRSRRGKAK